MYAAVLNSHTLPIKCGTGFDLEHSELNTSLYRQRKLMMRVKKRERNNHRTPVLLNQKNIFRNKGRADLLLFFQYDRGVPLHFGNHRVLF